MQTYQGRVNAAQSLNELCLILNDIASEEGDNMDRVDLCALPTFGGPGIGNTSEIYSWDETHVLVCNNEWEIKPRD